MKKRGMLLLAAVILGCSPACWAQEATDVEKRVEWLLRQLTLDEKLSLMMHHNPAIPRVGLPEYSWWNEALHGVGRAGLATVYPMPIALAATFNPPLVHSIFDHVAFEARQKYYDAQDTGGYGDYTGLTFFTPIRRRPLPRRHDGTGLRQRVTRG